MSDRQPVSERRAHDRLDRRDPFVVDLLDVIGRTRQAGATGVVRRTVTAPAGLGWDLTGVPAGSPVRLELRLESVTEGVLVTGRVDAGYADECARCLEPVTGQVEADITELYAYPHSTTDRTADQDEVLRTVDDLIDLQPVVRDAVVLALPAAPLCRPDCPGLCADCGKRWDDLPDGHRHDTIDPRFAALAHRLSPDAADA